MSLNLSIRQKLALLAGIPVIGAAVLAVQSVSQATEQLKAAQSLGSIESLVELSKRTTNLLHSLESECTSLMLVAGYRVSTRTVGELGTPESTKAVREAGNGGSLAVGRTDEALNLLNEFIAARSSAALPAKLSSSLKEARQHLTSLAATRQRLERGEPAWEASVDYYARAARLLTDTVAGLTELTNDGELLRTLNSLVALLELEASASAEHALFGYVLAVGEYPPGTYRRLVSTATEQELYQNVFLTVANLQAKQAYDTHMQQTIVTPVSVLRSRLMGSADDELTDRPEHWLDVGRLRLDAMTAIERRLHEASQDFAVEKQRQVKRHVVLSGALTGGTILFILAFAGWLARGITKRLNHMRMVVEKVGDGNLSVRADVSNRDELGQLGEAFNTMVREISQSRIALSTQARMARDLEIATEIQNAMLPKAPTHPEFEFAGRMLPADEVGGDFYDVLTDGGALWLTVGDVCGHGIGSGLVMVMTQVAFASAFIQDSGAEPAEVWRRVNRLLCENIKLRLGDDRYVTAQLLTYRGNGEFSCVGAHQWPIVFRAKTGQCEVLESTGPWLGLDPDQQLVPGMLIALDPGDVLCLYSDGLPESQDQNGELFDVERMQATLARSLRQDSSISNAVADLYNAVAEFSGRRDDDWTLLLVRRRDEESCHISRLEMQAAQD